MILDLRNQSNHAKNLLTMHRERKYGTGLLEFALDDKALKSRAKRDTEITIEHGI